MTAAMTEHPYDSLTPEAVMEAVESRGLLCDARLLALNSYENRVYQVGIEDDVPLVAKFYRPQRWTRDQIEEEHAFTLELAEADISVVAPLPDGDGNTVSEFGDFLFALFPRRGGHAPELDNLDNLLVLGRTVGRIHAAGRARRASRCRVHRAVAARRTGALPESPAQQRVDL